MQVEREELAALLTLQTIDLDIMQKTKEFDELPQRDKILKLRTKKEALAGQLAKVSKYKKDAKQRLGRMNDEDASLTKRQASIQAAIEAAHGDFRNVEARSKELAGITRRPRVGGPRSRRRFAAKSRSWKSWKPRSAWPKRKWKPRRTRKWKASGSKGAP